MSPLVANRYIPRSVASEHSAGASGAAPASVASALPAPAMASGNSRASAPTCFFMPPPRTLVVSRTAKEYTIKDCTKSRIRRLSGDEDHSAPVERFGIARSGQYKKDYLFILGGWRQKSWCL